MIGPDESHQKVFTCLSKLFLGCFGLIAFLVITASLTIRILSPRPRGNYVAVDYKKGKVIIHQWNDGKMIFPPGNYLREFSITEYKSGDVTTNKAWLIRRKSAGKRFGMEKTICGGEELSKAMSKVVFGEVPSCYVEEIRPKPLEKWKFYYVSKSRSPGYDEAVWFRLRACKHNSAKTCLVTNSPLNRNEKELDGE